MRENIASISELTERIYKNAISKGWYEEERSFGDIISLCHAELSEALEEYRNGHKPNDIYYSVSEKSVTNGKFENDLKPEGIPIELADVVIRIMDYCGHVGIDLQSAIEIKMAYNESRSYKHGGKVI
jgi:NTP pyrophosphatase (non-canonical NTP hydrolase)